MTSPDAASPIDAPSPVALVAGAMADLHEALRTDKARGAFCRGGPWDARLRELAEGESLHSLPLAQPLNSSRLSSLSSEYKLENIL